jgi:DNA-binding transcriptional ArsR family regulator
VKPTRDVCEPHGLDLEKVDRWRDAAPDMGYVVSLFKAMGDRTRLSLLYLISKEEWCVHDLAEANSTSVSNVSHHLRLLRAMRVVKCRRQGKRVLYSLDDEHVQSLLTEAFKHASHT